MNEIEKLLKSVFLYLKSKRSRWQHQGHVVPREHIL